MLIWDPVQDWTSKSVECFEHYTMLPTRASNVLTCTGACNPTQEDSPGSRGNKYPVQDTNMWLVYSVDRVSGNHTLSSGTSLYRKYRRVAPWEGGVSPSLLPNVLPLWKSMVSFKFCMHHSCVSCSSGCWWMLWCSESSPFGVCSISPCSWRSDHSMKFFRARNRFFLPQSRHVTTVWVSLLPGQNKATVSLNNSIN